MSLLIMSSVIRFSICFYLIVGTWALPKEIWIPFQQPQESAVRKECDIQPVVGPAANSWHDLVPLHSTRQDIDRKLGKPDWSHGFTYIYKTAKERVDVLYSAGCCELSGVERWNVPADTVIRIEVAPTKKVFVTDLHLDQKYVRINEAHPENWVMYWDTERGIMVHAAVNKGREEVMTITYQPTAKDKSLSCSSKRVAFIGR